VLSASKTYGKKDFQPDTALEYFRSKCGHYYMSEATKEYVDWCLATYAEKGWKGLKKKLTKAKYREITSQHPDVEIFETLRIEGKLPPLPE
jgi:hypothetical protein